MRHVDCDGVAALFVSHERGAARRSDGASGLATRVSSKKGWARAKEKVGAARIVAKWADAAEPRCALCRATAAQAGQAQLRQCAPKAVSPHCGAHPEHRQRADAAVWLCDLCGQAQRRVADVLDQAPSVGPRIPRFPA